MSLDSAVKKLILLDKTKRVSCSELLVVLYDIYKENANRFQRVANQGLIAEYSSAIRKYYPRVQTMQDYPLLVDRQHWEALGNSTDRNYFIASLEMLAILVDENLHFQGLPGEEVQHPISCKSYFLLRRQESPWRGSSRYNTGNNIPMQLHIVPKLTGFENVFYKLPDQIIGELERAIQTITPFSGQPAISVARMALWPVDKCLDFSIIKETVTSSFSFKDTPHVMFFLKDENDWKKQADHFQQKILPLCQEKQIMVLTLPELTAPPGLLELLKAAMKNHHQAQVDKARAAATTGPVVSYPLLLVAGSFHISQDDDPQQAVNQALVLDKRGDEIILEHYLRPPLNFDGEPKWSMEKLHPFTIRNSQLSNAPELARNLGLDDTEVAFAAEPGRLGDKLPIVHAGALGRMAVVICIDFLAGLKSWLDKFQGKGWMDWLFVPAASTETAPFAATNKDWGNRGVCTLVVNACWLVEAANKWPAQFVQAGIPTGLPTDGQRKRWHAWEHPELKTSDKFGLSPKTTDCCTMGCDNCLSILEVELDRKPGGPLTALLH